MTQFDDSALHRLIEDLLDVEPSMHAEWLARKVPDDPALRARLLKQFASEASAAPLDVGFSVYPADSETLPHRIGRYRSERACGAGRIGRAYLAHEEQTGQSVAVKMLRSGLSTPELQTRFRHEVQAAAQLIHPNIVTIIDVLEHDGRPCIVMEYVDGRTLFDVIEARERMSLSRKLEIIEHVCAALAHAHRKGIIHHDLKPSNVMLDNAGGVKVLDFVGSDAFTGTTSQQDISGPAKQPVVGTVAYLSPEQLLGQPASPSSDIFAASVLAYELLTYGRPFGIKLVDIRSRILRGDVQPFADWPVELPDDVERAILTGLSANPHDRFQDMGIMQQAFSEARSKRSQGTLFANHGGEAVRTLPRLFGAVWRLLGATRR